MVPVITRTQGIKENEKIKVSAEELMLLNCGAREDSFESPLDSKEIQLVHPKGDQLNIHWKD